MVIKIFLLFGLNKLSFGNHEQGGGGLKVEICVEWSM